MRHSAEDGTSVSVSTPPNAFDAAFLTQVQGEEEPLTASEADLAGPWKLEALHPAAGWPGAVAVLRAWECLDKGDVPEAVFLHQETGALPQQVADLAAAPGSQRPGRSGGSLAVIVAGRRKWLSVA